MDNQIISLSADEIQFNSKAFKDVINGLNEAENQIDIQCSEKAAEIINNISDSVKILKQESILAGDFYKREQQKATQTVASIIEEIGKSYNEIQSTQIRISELASEKVKQEVNSQELQKQLAELSGRMAEAARERDAHQRKLDELNNDSAESIIVSIFCLGLDRAIQGIASLVEQDAAHLDRLRDEMNRFSDAIKNGEDQVRISNELLQSLTAETERQETHLRELEIQSEQMQIEEKNVRARLASATQIAGFYGRLESVCGSTGRNITGVRDIIDELNDTQPRIIDIDPSCMELISLRTALAKMNCLINDEDCQKNRLSNF